MRKNGENNWRKGRDTGSNNDNDDHDHHHHHYCLLFVFTYFCCPFNVQKNT